ncbi:hypothetical protein MVEG_01308 [Podila verticillata NRRL 6337]|nr:hypothetical protein MVEG_01308 [Podila verticillata NRRL 6337]
MFEIDGETVRLPLCVRYSTSAYQVISCSQKGHQAAASHYFHLTRGQLPTAIVQEPLANESAHHLDCLFRSLNGLSEDLLEATFLTGLVFRQMAANTLYYHSQTLKELERLKCLEIRVEVDGMNKDQLYAHLHELEQTALQQVHLCDCRDEEGTLQQVHLSNHPGYRIRRPQDFFQTYGDYVLRVLHMVDRGYSDDYYTIPPLNTFDILSGCETAVTKGWLSKDTIESLVAKAITYLQDLSPPKWIKEPSLTRKQSAAVKTYLDVPDDMNTGGDLYQYINSGQNVHWICKEHAQQCFNEEALESLSDFVQSHNGHVNMHQATLQVDLGSTSEAEQFLVLLKGCFHTLNLSIKLNWKPSRPLLEKLCKDIATSGTVVLELDGITPDVLPQGRVHYMNNLFGDTIIPRTDLEAVALLNYPRPQEQYLFVKDLALHLTSSPARSATNWIELKTIIETFSDLVYHGELASDDNAALIELMSAIEKNQLPAPTMITMGTSEWSKVLDLNEFTFTEAFSTDMDGQESVLFSGSLQKLTVHFKDLELEGELSYVVEANPLLQELNVSYFGHDVLYYTECIVGMWLDFSVSSCLTLIDRMADSQGRVLAQLTRRSDSYPDHLSDCNTTLSDQTIDSDLPSSQQDPLLFEGIEFLQWDCDEIFSQLDDYSVSFLEMATEQHPSVLTLFTLDISQLSHHGLASVEKVILRSNLEHLKIVCTSIDPFVSDSVAQVLMSVQWSTLKSLKLAGDDIDTWILLWMSAHSNLFSSSAKPDITPRLQHLHLHGSRLRLQLLSHPSALFVHGLMYANPAVEVYFRNVDLPHRDWELILDSIDIAFFWVS